MIVVETKKEVLPLDENKDFLTEENEFEATPETDQDGYDFDFSPAEDALSYSDEADDSFLYHEDAADEESVASEESAGGTFEPKKKRTVQFTILVSAAIVAVVLLAAAVCRLFFFQGVVNTGFFGNQVKTTWHYKPDVTADATADEVTTPDFYFIYEPDGKLKVELGSFEYQRTYTIQYLDAKDVEGMENAESKVGKPVLNIENSGIIDGKFFFERTGNAFSESHLILTSVTNDQVKLDFDSQEYVPAAFEREGEFHKDDALLGKWNYKNEVGEQTFTFNTDGTYSLFTKANNQIQSQHGIYDCQDGKMTLYFQYLNDQAQEFKYTIKDNKLSLTMIMEFMGQSYEQSAGEFTKVTE